MPRGDDPACWLGNLSSSSIAVSIRLRLHAYTHALFDIISLAFSVLAVRGLSARLSSIWSEPESRGWTLMKGMGTGVLIVSG